MRFKAVALVLTAVALGLLATPVPAEAQKAERVARIGWLGPIGDGTGWSTPFLKQMREFGWDRGKNFEMEYRLAPSGKFKQQLPTLAAELVGLKVDVIVAVSTPGAITASKTTTTIPVVMAGVSNFVVHRGLVQVASLARPGANVTGLIHNPGKGFSAKMLELLKEAAPEISRVAFFVNGTLPAAVKEVAFKELQTAAQGFGMTVLLVDVDDTSKFPEAFAEITRERADALFGYGTSLNFRGMKPLVDFATKHRLPMMFGAKEFVEAGGLMSYWTDWDDLKRRSAIFADKILRGANPGDLPVERPTKFELVINLKTAKALGLTIPPSVLIRADKVIE